jgi:hypothetical protein
MTLPELPRASAQHIGLLNDRRRLLDDKRHRLVDALVSAELQFLAALSREHEAGRTSPAQLREAYGTLAAGKLHGLRARWIDAIGISPEKTIADAKAEAARRARRAAQTPIAVSRQPHPSADRKRPRSRDATRRSGRST